MKIFNGYSGSGIFAEIGSKTGTQGKKGAYLRGILPEELCKEIILSVNTKTNTNRRKR